MPDEKLPQDQQRITKQDIRDEVVRELVRWGFLEYGADQNGSPVPMKPPPEPSRN